MHTTKSCNVVSVNMPIGKHLRLVSPGDRYAELSVQRAATLIELVRS